MRPDDEPIGKPLHVAIRDRDHAKATKARAILDIIDHVLRWLTLLGLIITIVVSSRAMLQATRSANASNQNLQATYTPYIYFRILQDDIANVVTTNGVTNSVYVALFTMKNWSQTPAFFPTVTS